MSVKIEEDRIFTQKELLELARKFAESELGVKLEQAWQQLDDGELIGTIAEAELVGIRFLLTVPSPYK